MCRPSVRGPHERDRAPAARDRTRDRTRDDRAHREARHARRAGRPCRARRLGAPARSRSGLPRDRGFRSDRLGGARHRRSDHGGRSTKRPSRASECTHHRTPRNDPPPRDDRGTHPSLPPSVRRDELERSGPQGTGESPHGARRQSRARHPRGGLHHSARSRHRGRRVCRRGDQGGDRAGDHPGAATPDHLEGDRRHRIVRPIGIRRRVERPAGRGGSRWDRGAHACRTSTDRAWRRLDQGLR